MGRGIKTVELNERDLFSLFLLNKFRVLDAKSLAILGGFPSESYCSTRLQKLARYGYIKREKAATTLPLIHYLTTKGNDEVSDRRTKHKPTLTTLEKELAVGQVASFLCLKKGIQPKDVITDRELRQYERQLYDVRAMEHKGNLLFVESQSGDKVVVEVELTFKGRNRTVKNIQNNRKYSDRQLWFIKKSMRGLRNLLLEEGINEADIFYIDNLEFEGKFPEEAINKDISEYSFIENIQSFYNQ